MYIRYINPLLKGNTLIKTSNMSEEFEDEENNGLSYSEQRELEDMIVDTAFRNSFLVITKKKKFEDILNAKIKNGISAILAHQPEEEASLSTLENMMAYFVDTEEYEKCSEIRDIINSREIEGELKEMIPDLNVIIKNKKK